MNTQIKTHHGTFHPGSSVTISSPHPPKKNKRNEIRNQMHTKWKFKKWKWDISIPLRVWWVLICDLSEKQKGTCHTLAHQMRLECKIIALVPFTKDYGSPRVEQLGHLTIKCQCYPAWRKNLVTTNQVTTVCKAPTRCLERPTALYLYSGEGLDDSDEVLFQQVVIQRRQMGADDRVVSQLWTVLR